MRRMCVALSVLFLSASSVGAVSFDWAVIGNPGNPADNTGYGSVGYQYSISKYEVTTAQYVEFLNSVAKTDTYGLYNTNMGGSTYYSGISRTGSSGSYTYTSNAGWENRPVVYVSWYDTLRFVNWLHNGQPTGLQGVSTTEDGAYKFTGATIVNGRNVGAMYFLPSENEWYKAAYYDSIAGVYYDYATGSDTLPLRTTPSGDTGNSANYYDGNSYLFLTDVGAYSFSDSPYGTYDQSGNAWEWNETIIGSNRVYRGGSWNSRENSLPASYRGSISPAQEYHYIGFRIASFYTGEEGGNEPIPEPASIGLVMLSLSGLALRRAKKS
ncbi:MAG: SUMF1/EgtB/PvdO family nonheme iron enzyme [Candidatus Auribacterota bacterium]|nr:SUMF1/EgtB/PvdO family nonheme iron enzyme [Candidatus Auribacterota bacterium]